ncbi:MAG: STAS domain-containing protein [Acidimicrobiales bacterium]
MVDVEVVKEAAATICRPIGELDAFSVQDFRDHLSALAGESAVIIDLSGVPFMDSAGLGALIGGIRKIREASGEVVVVCDRAAVLRLLHTTRFDRMVTVVALLEQAHSELAGAGS